MTTTSRPLTRSNWGGGMVSFPKNGIHCGSTICHMKFLGVWDIFFSIYVGRGRGEGSTPGYGPYYWITEI